jgi:hypothetical protein
MIRVMGSIAVLVVASSAGAAEQQAQKTFASPEQAAAALFLAVQAGDDQALLQILGDDPDILRTDDKVQDDRDRQTFLAKYREMHRIARDGDLDVLYVGAENWPFPIPLSPRNGTWYFDTDSGAEEIRLRRIGENELSAVDLCRTIDGLDERDAASVVGNTTPLNGYYFRKVASAAKRPAFVAYPAVYGSSGIATFVVSPDRVVYERDLGPRTANVASTLRGDKLDRSWQPVQ